MANTASSSMTDGEASDRGHPEVIDGNGSKRVGDFATLPPRNSEHTLDSKLLVDLVEISFQPIDFVSGSAWAQLAPSLFVIFRLLKPRRYVELGTHTGMSFFAACQASKYLSLNSECVAVDNWVGDDHAGFHSADVFEKFEGFLRFRYPEQFYVKSDFRQALERFEDASIDLLHIDGFHSYESVKTDFESWLPKLSNEGVVIIHDINVHERDFGVWRFWDEIKQQYLTFSFFHCYGLGIVCVGKSNNLIRSAIERLANDNIMKTTTRLYLQLAGRAAAESRDRLERIFLLERERNELKSALLEREDVAKGDRDTQDEFKSAP